MTRRASAALILLLSLTLCPSLPAQSQAPPPPVGGITCEQVIRLSQSGLSDDVILAQIRKRPEPFDLSQEQLLALKKAHISNRVIEAMMASVVPPTVAPVPHTVAAKQPQPRVADSPLQPIAFKGHVLGENVHLFFASATVSDSGRPTLDYCADLLNNPKAMKKRLGQSLPAEMKGCQQVMAAVQGMDVEVNNRYVAMLGPGSSRFHAGKLVYIQLVLESPYPDVVEDMSRKLNASPEQSSQTYQNGYGALVQRRKARWSGGDLSAMVEEAALDADEQQTVLVTVFDSSLVSAGSQSAAARPNTLDATPPPPPR
jgi:hypothetical protein